MPAQALLARKNFIRRISITGLQAISLANLMNAAAAVTNTPAWGTNSDGSLSLDAFTADFVSVIPTTEALYVGYDLQVKDADAAGAYAGVPVAAGDPFNSSHYFRGPVAAEDLFFYSVGTQTLDIIFQGIS